MLNCRQCIKIWKHTKFPLGPWLDLHPWDTGLENIIIVTNITTFKCLNTVAEECVPPWHLHAPARPPGPALTVASPSVPTSVVLKPTGVSAGKKFLQVQNIYPPQLSLSWQQHSKVTFNRQSVKRPNSQTAKHKKGEEKETKLFNQDYSLLPLQEKDYYVSSWLWLQWRFCWRRLLSQWRGNKQIHIIVTQSNQNYLKRGHEFL